MGKKQLNETVISAITTLHTCSWDRDKERNRKSDLDSFNLMASSTTASKNITVNYIKHMRRINLAKLY